MVPCHAEHCEGRREIPRVEFTCWHRVSAACSAFDRFYGNGRTHLTTFTRGLFGGMVLVTAFAAPLRAVAQEPAPDSPPAETSAPEGTESSTDSDPGSAPVATYEDVLFVEE